MCNCKKGKRINVDAKDKAALSEALEEIVREHSPEDEDDVTDLFWEELWLPQRAIGALRRLVEQALKEHG